MKQLKFINTVMILFLIISNLFSAFQNIDWSVRAESMGGVATAFSEEPQGIFYNPAGISLITRPTIQMYYSKPYTGVENVDFSFKQLVGCVPFKSLNFSLGYGIMDVNNLYSETVSIFAIGTTAKKLNKNLPFIQFGLGLKLLTKQYNYNDEILMYEPHLKSKTSQSAFSLDIGVSYKTTKDKFKVGVALKDLNQPDLAIIKEDILPLNVCLGSAYNFGDINIGLLYFEDFTVGLELRYRNQKWGDELTKFFYAVGVETYLNFHTIPIRFGINKNSINLGFGYHGIKVSKKITLGVNYAFGISTVVNKFGNHRVAMEIKF
ncbi:MAG: type IX secretion system membrane protein PorP/SprF [Endomicrobia bacterium]|nr:type IX secretion system membrane protein PorP/SprF [Endomicrobiia bacterium]